MSQKELQAEVTKCLGNLLYSSLVSGCTIYDASSIKECPAIRIIGSSQTILNKCITKLEALPTSYILAYRKNLNGTILDNSIFVMTYTDKVEFEAAVQVQLTLELEGILLLQKEILKRKKLLLALSKQMINIRKSNDN